MNVILNLFWIAAVVLSGQIFHNSGISQWMGYLIQQVKVHLLYLNALQTVSVRLCTCTTLCVGTLVWEHQGPYTVAPEPQTAGIDADFL